MSTIPGGLDTEAGPPMRIPLRHFLVGLALLLVGLAVGLASVVGSLPGRGDLVHVHLLLAGWICVTIMGAMTQFVPVWSGTALHSRRLATAQLSLLVAGLAVFATGLLAGAPWLVVGGGLLMLAGFWTFVYNVGRTLATVERFDVTEAHFAVALGWFLVLTALGIVLALDLATPVLGSLPVDHASLRGAHATVAVFGAVLTTVYGALYQLATMFTGTELRGVDHHLKWGESLAHPAGVVLLAGGRLVDGALPARLGGLLLVVAALAMAAILVRKLAAMQVAWTPMHTRYAVATAALAGWAALAGPAWLRAPMAPAHLLGGSGTGHLLVLGAVGFVVLGTLYHVVPFIVWVERYSDQLGFEPVPMVDDLYDDRLAAADATLLVAGTGLLVATDVLGLPAVVAGTAGTILGMGAVVFCANLTLVIHRHSPDGVARIVLGRATPAPENPGDAGESSEGS